jgi:hypothetical protein
MSDQVERWNKEQVKFHNSGVRKILLREGLSSNSVVKMGNSVNAPTDSCFNQYMCDRSTCVPDSGQCQVVKCDQKVNDYFDQKQLCHYKNDPADNKVTYNMYK